MTTILKLNDFPKPLARDRGKAEESAAYTAWQQMMKSSLEVANLWKFIDDAITPEAQQPSGTTKQAVEAATQVLLTTPAPR